MPMLRRGVELLVVSLVLLPAARGLKGPTRAPADEPKVTPEARWRTANALAQFSGGGDLEAPAQTPWGGEGVASAAKETFAVVVNTFRRNTCLQKVVENYMGCRGIVDTIRVVWNDPGREPPAWLSALEAKTDGNVADVAPRVVIDYNEGSNLTNRFKPRAFTSEAVFSQDDDLFYSCTLLSAGFKVWQAFPRQLVGFGPRWVPFQDPGLESRNAEGARAAWTYGRANVVLVTKGGWLHRDYYKAFFQPRLQNLRDLVDRNRTAEDMLMALLVANHTGLPPVPLLVPSRGPDLPSWWPESPFKDWLPGPPAQSAEKHLTNFEFLCGGGLTEGVGNSNRQRANVFRDLMEAFEYYLPSTTQFVDPLKGYFGEPGMASSTDDKYVRFNRLNSTKTVLPSGEPSTCATYEQSIRGHVEKLSPEDAFLAMLDPLKKPMLDEEHGMWQPDGCNLRLYRPAEACDVLQRMGHKRVLFIGDSFMRQFYLAFLQTLLDGNAEGQVLAPKQPWAPSSAEARGDLSKCTADVVAVEVEGAKFCRHQFARDTRQQFDEQRQSRLCGGQVDLEFVYGGVTNPASEEYPQISSANRSATLVVMGYGIWYNFDSTIAIPVVHDHLQELRSSFKDPMVIWHAAHARHRFDFAHQSNEDVLQFNSEMKDWANKFTAMKILDFYNATVDMHSFDGAHYGPGPNRVKSMLLLSFLESLGQQFLENLGKQSVAEEVQRRLFAQR
mmetsp:Transcript_47202/g.127403  ORF Transcript_47202/g.127403 Transcript_47202/m.127403 type:complete len:725 (+) Transcript_47202:99-2273(+)